MIKVSVTVPVYNVAKYLPRCLETILNQNFSSFEVICVDDGSTDGSSKILKDYAKRYPQLKIIHQSNQGLSVARNTAMKEAIGKYIMFVDADDFLYSRNALDYLYSYAEFHNSDVVIFDFVGGTDDG